MIEEQVEVKNATSIDFGVATMWGKVENTDVYILLSKYNSEQYGSVREEEDGSWTAVGLDGTSWSFGNRARAKTHVSVMFDKMHQKFSRGVSWVRAENKSKSVWGER